MKFCEKLQKLRKEKGYSQEELADLLDVSRQSVSKWESGTTYPEMDKLLSLCKIFNISLDDLTNDEISTESIKEKNKNNFSNLVDAILEMVSKSIEMFKGSSKKDVIKYITELLILFVILLLFKIPFNYLNSSVLAIFTNFEGAYSLLSSIWLFFSNTIYLVLFLTIFLYVYKTRYLDTYTKKEIERKDKNNEEDKNDNESFANTTVNEKIKKERHSFIIFDFLESIFNIFIKICLFFISIPVIICFVILLVITVLALTLEFIGIHYIGFFIGLLGCSIVGFVIMEIILRLLFNSSLNFKRLFITFTSGLIIGSIGVSVITIELSHTRYIDTVPESAQKVTYEQVYDMNDELLLVPYYQYKADFIIDETMTDSVKLKIHYYDDYLEMGSEVYDNYITIHEYSDYDRFINLVSLIKDNLKNKVFYNYNELVDFDIEIITSSQNVNRLKENYQKHNQEQVNYRYDEYERQIEILENDLEDKEDTIERMREQIEDLQTKLDNISHELN